MTTKRRAVVIAAGAALLAAVLMAGYGVRVLAEGAPTQQPLFYSGSLEANGALANGDYTVKLSLYATATGGTALCSVDESATVENGRFRIDASACADAIAAEPDVWLAVSFTGGDGKAHAIAGRSKVGAVPYALEAQHAVSASAVSANGTLATTLQQIDDRLAALEAVTLNSGFLAYKTQQQTLTEGGTKIVFENEVYDSGGEYNPQTGIFKAKASGHYEFSCTVSWDVGPNTIGTWEVSFHVNGFERTYGGSYGDGVAATRSLTSTIELSTGEEVYCAALQSLSSSVQMNLGNDHTFVTFSGHRI